VAAGTLASVAPPPAERAAWWRRVPWLKVVIAAVLVASVVLRFLTKSPMWLDEAQTTDIAHRSLPHMFSALKRDGSPPLFYLLLHGWTAMFGTGSFAVRSLSGIFAVLCLPAIVLVVRRFGILGGNPWPSLLVLATSPFAIRYGSEARMYSLVMLLVLLAMLAYERVWSDGGAWSIAGAAVVTAALLLTQYWAIFLLAAGGLLAVVAWRRGSTRARRLLVPMVLGCVPFIPWLPTFLYQSAHTGAPWGPPPGVEVPLLVPGSWVGGGAMGPLLRGAYYVLVILALFGRIGSDGRLSLGRPAHRRPALIIGVGFLTLVIAVLASDISSTAYAPRYSAIVFTPVVVAMSAGFAAVPRARRNLAIGLVVGIGLIGSSFIPDELRTQAGQVATVLQAAAPQDLVIFCPDQLGPAVHRIAPGAGTQVEYPTFGSAALVDWVDYAHRNETANPTAFARVALQRAQGHTIWYVYEEGYPTLNGGCASLLSSFTLARGQPIAALSPGGAFEKYNVAEFPPTS
jgi:4-amino-4-deoxy-L-arabinose transferase-like glycosyltransferase